MILCVYHGSSFKGVNEEQTKLITESIANAFPNHNVSECYYSSHVLKTMKRRNTPLLSFEEALKFAYSKEEKIYVLITNLMNGVEYQKIVDGVKAIDIASKVKLTPYLLEKSNVHQLAEAIVNKDKPTIFMGHGNNCDNNDYKRLNDILSEDSNLVMTMHCDINEALKDFYNKNIVVKPLMITSAYHAKCDIGVDLKAKLEALGYKPEVELSPLALNQNIHTMMISNLKTLIEDKEI